MKGTHSAIRYASLALVAPLSLALSDAAGAREDPLLTIPLRVRVAHCPPEGRQRASKARLAVQPATWVEAHVQAAEKILAPHRIALAVTYDTFEPERCSLLNRRQRNAMARYVPQQSAVVVLVTRRIRDLGLSSYDLMGVHWRYSGGTQRWRGRRWVFLTARARPPVLAHELAHYFGLRHDPAGGNLMTPGPSDPCWRQPGRKPRPFVPRLTAAQVERLRRSIGRLLHAAKQH